MEVIRNELSAYFDVDETLVIWHRPFHSRVQAFECPHTKRIRMLVPHQRNIDFLIEQKSRGYHITVWSSAGYDWAETVVRTLGLTSVVDHVRSKPTKYVDDLLANEILTNRIYFEFEE